MHNNPISAPNKSDAATGGVERTHIIDGRLPDSILLEVFTGAGCGTMIVGRKEKATYLGVDLAT